MNTGPALGNLAFYRKMELVLRHIMLSVSLMSLCGKKGVYWNTLILVLGPLLLLLHLSLLSQMSYTY